MKVLAYLLALFLIVGSLAAIAYFVEQWKRDDD